MNSERDGKSFITIFNELIDLGALAPDVFEASIGIWELFEVELKQSGLADCDPSEFKAKAVAHVNAKFLDHVFQMEVLRGPAGTIIRDCFYRICIIKSQHVEKLNHRAYTTWLKHHPNRPLVDAFLESSETQADYAKRIKLSATEFNKLYKNVTEFSWLVKAASQLKDLDDGACKDRYIGGRKTQDAFEALGVVTSIGQVREYSQSRREIGGYFFDDPFVDGLNQLSKRELAFVNLSSRVALGEITPQDFDDELGKWCTNDRSLVSVWRRAFEREVHYPSACTKREIALIELSIFMAFNAIPLRQLKDSLREWYGGDEAILKKMIAKILESKSRSASRELGCALGPRERQDYQRRIAEQTEVTP